MGAFRQLRSARLKPLARFFRNGSREQVFAIPFGQVFAIPFG